MSPVIWLAVTQDNLHVMSYDFEDPDNTAIDVIYKSMNLEQLIALAASRAGVFKSRNTHVYCERKYMDIVKKYFVECEIIPVEEKGERYVRNMQKLLRSAEDVALRERQQYVINYLLKYLEG